MARVEPHKLPIKSVQTTRITWQGCHWLVLTEEDVGLPICIPYRESDVWDPKPEVSQRNQGPHHLATTPKTSTHIPVDQKPVHLQIPLMAGIICGRGKVMF